MKNEEYWIKRFEQLEAAQLNKGIEYYNNLTKQYMKAIASVEKDLAKWYTRYANENGISLTEAKRMLNSRELAEFRMDVKEYIKKGESLNPKWAKQLEAASTKFHVSRLEALKVQMQQQAELVCGGQLDDIDALARKIYTDGYYHTAYEIQKGIGVGWDLMALDTNKIGKLISKSWAADGKNFSERIWGNRTQLVHELENTLTQSIIRGQSPKKVIAEIAQRFNVSKSRAGALVMTESAFFASAAQRDCFNDLDVERFEVVATLDSRTSPTCRHMDGKVLPMSEYKPGVTAPPFHARCRSTTVPYFDDEFTEGEQRAARDADGKYYIVPANMKYEEWHKTFVDGGSKDNLKVIEITAVTLQEIRANTAKLKNSMEESTYNQYVTMLQSNDVVARTYINYADEINTIKRVSDGGVYKPSLKALEWDYESTNGVSKFSVLAHEYGHYFDDVLPKQALTFKEFEALNKAIPVFRRSTASFSDEFLAAVRADKAHIKSVFSKDVKADFLAHHSSGGVQDAIDGLFPNSRINWGHGERYYNRMYNAVKSMGLEKELKEIYIKLGLDATNQTKVKNICRQYDAASEIWANVMSAATCGGEELEYVKKYLPNSYKTLMDILGGVK